MRILQLTNYPTANPLHGGQIRCYQIAGQLRQAGHDVHSVAVYVPGHYQDVGVEDIAVDTLSKFWRGEFSNLSDYFSGLFVANDINGLIQLRKKVDEFKPHVIIAEQPWLFTAAHRVASATTKLIYSSQNVEWRLKEKVISEWENKTFLADIKRIELDAVQNSALTIACTQADADYYESLKDQINKSPIIVAGNGVEPFSCEDARVDDWIHHFQQPFPVFVGSAHPPNASGFWEMMSPGLTFLKPWEKCVVIGGVCHILLSDTGLNDYKELNLARLDLAGTREKIELQAMVRASHVVLLPITVGEGSNLKTAEALESGRPIVGTTKAFRGFESAMSLPHVTIADTPDEFRRAVRCVLDEPRYTGGTPYEIRSKFYWSQQLQSIVDAILCLNPEF